MVIEILVKQPLLRSVLPDGTVVLLVVLHDERCAILRNNEMIHQAGGDAEGIDGAVQRFMALTQVTDVLSGEMHEEESTANAPAAGERAASRAERSRQTDSPVSPAQPPRTAAPGTSA